MFINVLVAAAWVRRYIKVCTDGGYDYYDYDTRACYNNQGYLKFIRGKLKGDQ